MCPSWHQFVVSYFINWNRYVEILYLECYKTHPVYLKISPEIILNQKLRDLNLIVEETKYQEWLFRYNDLSYVERKQLYLGLYYWVYIIVM